MVIIQYDTSIELDNKTIEDKISFFHQNDDFLDFSASLLATSAKPVASADIFSVFSLRSPSSLPRLSNAYF